LGDDVVTFRTWTTVEQALKKQIITVFKPMYINIINNDMVEFANTTARDMLEYFFLSYGRITAVDLEHKWENMLRSWDPQQPACLNSSRIKTVLIMQRQGRSPSVRRKNYKLIMRRSLPLAPSIVRVVIRTKQILKNRPGITSRSNLQLPTASTSKCREKQRLPPGMPTQLWNNLLMMILLEHPLMPLQTLQRLLKVSTRGR
jgi:hypothetical protein